LSFQTAVRRCTDWASRDRATSQLNRRPDHAISIRIRMIGWPEDLAYNSDQRI
jgi:hypothetical protein